MRIGAYAIEQDYSHYVRKASEIVLAIVGTATKGPINEPTLCSSPLDFQQKFGNLDTNCLGLYAGLYFLNQGSKIWYVRAADTEEAKKSSITIQDEKMGAGTALVLEAKTEGTYYDGYKVNIMKPGTDELYDIVIRNASGTEVEKFSSLTLQEIENIESKYIEFAVKTEGFAHITPGSYTMSGGNNGNAGELASAYINAANALNKDSIDMNLLSIPGVSTPTVITTVLSNVVEKRADCLYLIDPPSNIDIYEEGGYEELVNWHKEFNSSYGAVYYSWQRIYDSYNKTYVDVPPSVVVAPVIAYSTSISEIWYAPAGLKRGLVKGVVSPSVSIDSGAMHTLYTGDNSINCIYNDPQVGLCVFGQKTLHREDTALNRVNVRMLMNYLKKVIVAACRNLTFEPNDRVTWNNFEDLVEPTLKSIQNRRGLYEYKIVKGENIVTDEDIDNHRMPCKIMIKPTKSAEEIPIYFTITSTGAEFNDVLENDGILIEE